LWVREWVQGERDAERAVWRAGVGDGERDREMELIDRRRSLAFVLSLLIRPLFDPY
jgi:hypothetical protein